MSQPGLAHSEEGGTPVVGAASVGSKSEGAGVEAMKGLSGSLASLMSGDGEDKRRAAAKEDEDTNRPSEGQKGGKGTGQGTGYVWCLDAGVLRAGRGGLRCRRSSAVVCYWCTLH